MTKKQKQKFFLGTGKVGEQDLEEALSARAAAPRGQPRAPSRDIGGAAEIAPSRFPSETAAAEEVNKTGATY